MRDASEDQIWESVGYGATRWRLAGGAANPAIGGALLIIGAFTLDIEAWPTGVSGNEDLGKGALGIGSKRSIANRLFRSISFSIAGKPQWKLVTRSSSCWFG